MAANVQSVATSFKAELLSGIHALGATVTRASALADTFNAALYYQNSSMGAATTAYTSTNEVAGTGYTAGGKAVTNTVNPTTSGTTGYWTPSASIVWAGLTISSAFDCLLIYNLTQGNRAAFILTFSPQTISAGTFTVAMPANGPTSALIQLN